jgi:hypothetical protein
VSRTVPAVATLAKAQETANNINLRFNAILLSMFL